MIGYYESPKLWKELKYKGGILKNNEEIIITQISEEQENFKNLVFW